MITRVSGFFVLVLMACSLAGCGGGAGGGMGGSAVEPLSTDDLAAVEAVLLADRIDAAQALPVSASVVADLAPAEGADPVLANDDTPIQRRGRAYRARRQTGGWQVQRGAGSCPVAVDRTPAGWRIQAGTETCTATRAEDGSLIITRGNGTQMTIGQIPADGGSTTLTIGQSRWQVVFGTGEAPLATLTNTRTGRTLTVTESDTGELTVVPAGGSAFPGRWSAEGELACSDLASGRQYRYRGGR
ncbi:MAG: hypothetical protein OZSIB_1650 [Candidatus Ozemobacter sibiricus]|jgi:hypothetical protein|uniref:Lipoprotein n=1 Tax=Candidatus Ozemobacter sibiricus TaxID=2268124 RepID=A0A367ZJG5_9BACT|nr:MAG: hypothetical protein OZSIB_1650 [Candidatus Ozemobacter sibiricus]